MKINFQFQLSRSQQSEWAEFWSRSRHTHIQQHFLYAKVERGKRRKPIFIFGEVNSSIVCLGIFSIRPLFFCNRFSLEAVSLRGPVFDDISHFKDFIQLVIARFKALGVGSLRISPYWQFPEAEEVESVLSEVGFTPYYMREGSRGDTGRVDLQRNEDEILASFSKWTRKDIRRIEKFNVDILPAKTMEEALLAFRCLNKMRHKRGLTPMSLGEFSKTFQYILKDQNHGILFNAFSREEFLGGFWLIRGPQIAQTAGYAIEADSCNQVSNSLSIGPPLWWRGIQWAKKKGCSWLDVEGYSEGTEKSSPLYHIHEFKRKFRPQPVQIISEHIYICSSLTHAAHKGYNFFLRGCKFARSLPYQLKQTTFFGQRR